MSAYGTTAAEIREFLTLPRLHPPAFFYCPCGKLHTVSLIGPLSVCPSCERNLRAVLRDVMGVCR